jgi:hypothetical protein
MSSLEKEQMSKVLGGRFLDLENDRNCGCNSSAWPNYWAEATNTIALDEEC